MEAVAERGSEELSHVSLRHIQPECGEGAEQADTRRDSRTYFARTNSQA